MRKLLLLCLLALPFIFAGCSGGGAQVPTLRIIGWEGYMDPSVTAPFEQRYHCKVEATYAGSSDEMFAKIRAGGGSTYDLVTASGDLTKRLYDAGLLAPVDMSKVPNYKNLFPPFQKPPYNTFDGTPYGVSIAWGPDFLVYDSSVVKTPPQSWSVLYDPQYAEKVSLPDYPIFIADIALWNGKKDIYNLTDADLNNVIKPKLFALKPQVRKFWGSQGELTQLFENKEIAMAWGWPVTIEQLKKAGFTVGYTIPKEGTTGWSDSWMVLKDSPSKDLAYEWMNYMLEGDPQKKMTGITGYWPVSSAILPLLTPEQKKEEHLDDLATFYKQIHFWVTVRNYDAWTALWNQFRGQ